MKVLGPSFILYAAYASLLYLVAYFAEVYLAYFQPAASMAPVYAAQIIFSFFAYLGWIAVGIRFRNRLMTNVSLVAVWLVPLGGALNVLLASTGSAGMPFAFAYGLVMGAIVAAFGVSMLRLRKSFGDLARVTGWLDIMMGVCLLSFILIPVAAILMPPVIVLEAIVLFRAYEKARKGGRKGPLGLLRSFRKIFQAALPQHDAPLHVF
jgi:hypothetical protein